MEQFAISVACLMVSGFAFAQDETATLARIERELSSGTKTTSEILSDTSFMQLHAATPFRELVKKNASKKSITMVTATEPGTKISVRGILVDKNGNPSPGVLIYVYQTSSIGWYSDTGAHIQMNEGDRRHARLFGYLLSGADGSFELKTVKPQGYPKSELPAHIHFEATKDQSSSVITELLFDDDPRLVGTVRTRAINEGFVVSKNSGTAQEPIYIYRVSLK